MKTHLTPCSRFPAARDLMAGASVALRLPARSVASWAGTIRSSGASVCRSPAPFSSTLVGYGPVRCALRPGLAALLVGRFRMQALGAADGKPVGKYCGKIAD